MTSTVSAASPGVHRPEVIRLIGWLFVIAGGLQVVSLVTTLAWRWDGLGGAVSLAIDTVFLMVLPIVPGARLLGMHEGARRWLINLCILVKVGFGLPLLLAPVVVAVAALVGWIEFLHLPLWQTLYWAAALVAVFLVADCVTRALQSPEVEVAFRAAEEARVHRATVPQEGTVG